MTLGGKYMQTMNREQIVALKGNLSPEKIEWNITRANEIIAKYRISTDTFIRYVKKCQDEKYEDLQQGSIFLIAAIYGFVHDLYLVDEAETV